MHTPDAGRIRVRWYALPEPAPGVYELTDYGSSNFDADTYSYDPDIGEESSSRQPFDDWRDCCPPPWFGWRDDLCPTAVTPCSARYRVPSLKLSGVNVPESVWPSQVMNNGGPCLWSAGPVVVGADRYSVRLTVQNDGSLLLVVTLRHALLHSCVGTWSAPGPADMQQAIHLLNVTTGAFPVFGPATIIVRPVPDDVIGTDPCTGLATGSGAFILIS